MKGFFYLNMHDHECNCDLRTLSQNKTCWFEGKCCKSMIVYCKITGKSYFGQTQQYFKKRTMQHLQDVWQISKLGGDSSEMPECLVWYRRLQEGRLFLKTFCWVSMQRVQQLQRGTSQDEDNYDSINSLARRPYLMYEICTGTRTLRCNICMRASPGGLQSCNKWRSTTNWRSATKTLTSWALANVEANFISFFRNVTINLTLRMCSLQKGVNSNRRVKHQKCKRFTIDNVHTPKIQTPLCQPCNTTSTSSSEESASPQCVTPVFYLTMLILTSYTPTLTVSKHWTIFWSWSPAYFWDLSFYCNSRN